MRGRRDDGDAVALGAAAGPGAVLRVRGLRHLSVRDVHSWAERRVRDLPWGTWQVWLVVEVHRVRCRRCGALCVRMSETVPPPEITKEGETG